MDEYLAKIQEIALIYGGKILIALLIIVIGRFAARLLRKLLLRLLERANLDPTLVRFVARIAYVGMIAFVILAALSQLGIETTAFVAVLGALGLAIGLSLQGSLSNFAAGVIMIITRPFEVGDLIEAAGELGTVEDILIFTTKLRTVDGKLLVVPNSKVTNENIINYTIKGTRRTEIKLRLSYQQDIAKILSLLNELVDRDTRILKEPEPTIAVMELEPSYVQIIVRVWARIDEFWDVHFDTNRSIIETFKAEKVRFAPTRSDVHLFERGKKLGSS